MSQSSLRVYVDGGINPKTGMGGAGICVIMHEDGKTSEAVHAGFPILGTPESPVTNQVAELMAVVHGVEILRGYDLEGLDVQFLSDSAYVVNCFLQRWYLKWITGAWTGSSGGPVANMAIWRQVLSGFHDVSMQSVQRLGARPWENSWIAPEDREMLKESRNRGLKAGFKKVKGHSGVHGNEMADAFATRAKNGEKFLLEPGVT